LLVLVLVLALALPADRALITPHYRYGASAYSIKL
jgi:hypothetical protein